MFLVVNAKVPAKTVSELINYLKEHPDTNYVSAGLASIHQLVMEQFLRSTGLTAMHIPYRGVLQAVPALLTGDAKLMFNSLPSISLHVEVGTLRLLLSQRLSGPHCARISPRSRKAGSVAKARYSRWAMPYRAGRRMRSISG